MRILIIQTAFIGDVVLVTPLIQAAKEYFETAHTTVVVRPSTTGLLQNNPYVDDIVSYDKNNTQRGVRNLLGFAGRLRHLNFDLALIPHRSMRSALMAWLARIPFRVGFDTSAGKRLLSRKVPYRSVHEVERNLDLLTPWAVDTTDYRPSLFPDAEDQAFSKDFFGKHHIEVNRPIIGINPGSIWATKRWLPEYFADVARYAEQEMNAQVVLFGGPDDVTLAHDISERAGGSPVIAAGEATLLQSAALVARCTALVSNDSAMAHMAAAMDTPVLDIFGPTVPDFGFTPYGEGHQIIEHALPCRPCGKHGHTRCPIGTHACMTNITVEQVVERLNTVVGDQWPVKTN